jgi:hypothetical protein
VSSSSEPPKMSAQHCTTKDKQNPWIFYED